MDTKTSQPSSSQASSSRTSEDELPPPTYIESTTPTSLTTKLSVNPPLSPSTSTIPNLHCAQIATQLNSLTSQLSSILTQSRLHAVAIENRILSLLNHEIQVFLNDFSTTGLQDGKLVLIPAGAVSDEKALPIGVNFQDLDCYDRVVRVKDKEGAEIPTGPGQIFWYWNNKAMATRLASYLRPPQDSKSAELPPRTSQQAAEKKVSWPWKNSKPVIIEPKGKEIARDADDDKVLIDVRAEEIVFRTQSEFGIYGTERGWAIVLRLRVVLADM